MWVHPAVTKLHFFSKKIWDWKLFGSRYIYLKVKAYRKKLCSIIKAGFDKSWNACCVLGGYRGKEMILKDFIFVNINQYLFLFLFKYFHLVLWDTRYTQNIIKRMLGDKLRLIAFLPTLQSRPKHSDAELGQVSMPAKCLGTIYCTLFCDLPLTAHTAQRGTFPFVFSS